MTDDRKQLRVHFGPVDIHGNIDLATPSNPEPMSDVVFAITSELKNLPELLLQTAEEPHRVQNLIDAICYNYPLSFVRDPIKVAFEFRMAEHGGKSGFMVKASIMAGRASIPLNGPGTFISASLDNAVERLTEAATRVAVKNGSDQMLAILKRASDQIPKSWKMPGARGWELLEKAKSILSFQDTDDHAGDSNVH